MIQPFHIIAQHLKAHRLLKALILTICAATHIAHAETQERLISTDSGATELIFALDAADDLVAIDITSQLPEGHPALPNIGYHRALSAEGLMSLKPTFVIGSHHMGPPPAITALKQAKVRLVQLPSAKTKEQLRDNIKSLANELNQKDKGEQLLNTLETKISALEHTNLQGERVAFILSMDDSKLRLAGDKTNGNAFINLLGAKNVANFENYRNVSAESILALQPTIIFVAGRSVKNAAESLLKANPVLAHTPAGKDKKIISIDGSTLVAGLSVAAFDEAFRLTQKLSPSHLTQIGER